MFENFHFQNGGMFLSEGTWIHPQRTIESDELIYVFRGKIYIKEENDSYVLETGDIFRLEHGKQHGGTEPSHDVAFCWFHFLSTDETEELPKRWHMDQTSRLDILCRQLLHCSERHDYPQEGLDYFLRLIFIELSLGKSRVPLSALVSKIREWIRVHAEQIITARTLAEQFGYNEDYINRIFKRSYPQGLKHYIDQARLDRIKHMLLLSEMPLKEIASSTGFSEYKYFLKFFTYHEGMTPTAYREAYFQKHTNRS